MEPQEYYQLGLKAGLEIHQQLDTGTKLFCNCPSFLRNDPPEITIKRKLHAVAGETGEVDSSVEYEASRNREFYYQGYHDSTCLIELDEEPPRLISETALNEALTIALLLKCEIYQVTQIMRKTVIDGSNTSGFQRTVLIARNGILKTSKGDVGIETIALEEDAARIIEKDDKKSIYRLDRLGIPLVEITTTPALRDPEHIKETALKFGEILRACKVRRGIGTIRQDINVSVRGHDKVEIKGFQDPALMVKTIELEVQRQVEDLKNNKKTGEVRNALPDCTTEFLRPLPGRARMYPETDLPLLRIPREKINTIKKQLPKLKHEIQSELKKKGLSDELISLVLEGNLDEFETLLQVYGKNSNLVAKMITLWRSELATRLKKPLAEIKEILSERILEQILEALRENRIGESDIRLVMEKVAIGTPFETVLGTEKISADELEGHIRKIIKENPGLKPNAYMGLIMQQLKGKLNPGQAMQIVQKILATE